MEAQGGVALHRDLEAAGGASHRRLMFLMADPQCPVRRGPITYPVSQSLTQPDRPLPEA